MTPEELKRILADNPDLAVQEYAYTASQTATINATPTSPGKTRTVPEYLDIMSEHDAQVAVFAWADASGIPELEMLHATPNGGYRPAHVGAQMKQEGQKAGYPDISLDVARGRWHGLRIELKVGRNKPTQLQLDWLGRLRAEGYMAVVCYGFEDAKRTILAYLGLEE